MNGILHCLRIMLYFGGAQYTEVQQAAGSPDMGYVQPNHKQEDNVT